MTPKTNDELVEQLKMLATGFHGMGDDKQPASKFAHNIIANYCDEAAARIAELTAERDALKARVETAEAVISLARRRVVGDYVIAGSVDLKQAIDKYDALAAREEPADG